MHAFWHKYLTHLVLAARPLSFSSLIIRAVADHILRRQQNDYTDEDFREFITKLCWLPVLSRHIFQNFKTYLPQGVEDNPENIVSSVCFKEQLLNAAAYVGCTNMVKDLTEQGFDQYDNR
jgi:hypothetical protein